MNAVVLAGFLAITALWPFGRDRQKEEGTIKSLEREVVEVETGVPIDGSAAKAIDSYRRFLELAADDPALKAEAMRRLADLELESEEGESLAGDAAELVPDLSGTIDLYTQLLETYPDYAKNDLVLYQLARAYEAVGEIELALATLDRLVAEYPGTEHASEAQFRRGETLFVEQRYAEAEAAYERVLAAADAAYTEQSLYKLGWARFKQARHDESLEPFFELLDGKLGGAGAGGDGGAADDGPERRYDGMGRAEQELVDDTLRILSITFTYLDGAESISEYLSGTGLRPYTYIVYSHLGTLYLDQERYQDAADTYQAFVDLDPYHAKAPLLQAEVIEAYKQGGFTDLVLDGKRNFVEGYGADSPYWDTRTFADEPEVAGHLKANLTDLAAFHHAQAQETGADDEYRAAARWYRSFLGTFPDAVEAPSTNFLLSEVLYESGDFGDAALEYERTAYAYPFHERSSEAGYAALLAYAEHEKTLTGEPLAAWHRQGIGSALRFAAAYPEHDEAEAAQVGAAEKLFALDEFVAARDAALGIAYGDAPGDPDLRRTALTVVAHSEFDLERFAEAESAYLDLKATQAPAEDPLFDIDERIASSIYKQGEQAQAAGDAYGAVDHFLRLGAAVPHSPIRATAEYDAAATLIRLEDWPRAAAVLEEFRARYPDHELAADVTASLAVAYVETGESVRAAAEFERIAGGDGAPEVRKEALWRAAELYTDSGENAAAAAAFERYVSEYPDPFAEAIEAQHRLVELARARSDTEAQWRWLDAIIDADARAGDARTDRSRSLAARAQLELAEPARDAFHAARLVVPLQDSLAVKRERMEVALDLYGKAADYGVADVTTAATYEIAELYAGLGRALFDSERPPELTPEELAQYDLLLEEQAYPFEEQAIELHEVNAGKTDDGIYDEWVAKSIQALATLVPVRYAKLELGEQFVTAMH